MTKHFTAAKFGLFATVTWISFWYFAISKNKESFLLLRLNEVGDFLAGAIGPIALLWLVLGYFLQGQELKNQAKELRNSVEAQIAISEENRKQLKELKISTAYDAYQSYSERMTQLRIQEGEDLEISSIWLDGPEEKAVQEFGPKHFYFAKNLLQAHEGYFLNLTDKDVDTDRMELNLNGWRANFKNDLKAQIFRKIWQTEIVKKSYHEKFQACVDELILEIESEQ